MQLCGQSTGTDCSPVPYTVALTYDTGGPVEDEDLTFIVRV